MTLIELLAVMSLLTVVLGATVTAFANFNKNERSNRTQNEAQDQAREGIGTVARQLRNLASPTEFLPEAVERAEPTDLIFQTVYPLKPDGSENDRNITRVRYCLGPSSGGKAVVQVQSQNPWVTARPPGIPPTTECPGPGWDTTRSFVTNVVNREANQPIFSYNSTDLQRISSIDIELFVDTDPTLPPRRTRLASGVYLRNQNRPPVASFTATYTATGSGKLIVLNGSASEDPEGHNLKSFRWYVTEDGVERQLPDNSIVVNYEAPGPGTYRFRLVVEDHAGLPGTAESAEGVVVPGEEEEEEEEDE